jgi:hypothetical protein
MTFSFDVSFSSHDALKAGVTEPDWHRVVVSAPDRDTAALTACQMVACCTRVADLRRVALWRPACQRTRTIRVSMRVPPVSTWRLSVGHRWSAGAAARSVAGDDLTARGSKSDRGDAGLSA